MKPEAPSLFRRIVVFSIGAHIFAVCVFVAWQAMHPESAKTAGASAPSGGGASHSDNTAEAAKSPAPSAPAPVKEYDVDTQRNISFDDEDKMIAPLKRKAQAIQKNIDKMTTEQKLATVGTSGAILQNSVPEHVVKASGIAMKAFGLKEVAASPAEDVPQPLGGQLDITTLTITNMYRKGGKVISVYRDASGYTQELDMGTESKLDPADKQELNLYDQARANPNLLPLINAVTRARTALANDLHPDAKPLSP